VRELRRPGLRLRLAGQRRVVDLKSI
jgi:hypothetical protein